MRAQRPPSLRQSKVTSAILEATKFKNECDHRCVRQTALKNWAKIVSALLVPLILGVFTVVQTLQQQKISSLQRKQDQYQADNTQNEDIFAKYIDDVSRFILKQNTFLSQTDKVYLRTQTLTALRKLDTKRRSQLFLFLLESQLLSGAFSLCNANLNNIDASSEWNAMSEMDKMNESNDFYLPNVNLRNASFARRLLRYSTFDGSQMDNSNFTSCILWNTTFVGSSMKQAVFQHAIMDGVDFSNAKLVEADFTDALLVGSINFVNTDLLNAKITSNQLTNSVLLNARLPNGSFTLLAVENILANSDGEDSHECNDEIYGWEIEGNVRLQAYNESTDVKHGQCYFSGLEGSQMKQKVDLINFTLLIDNHELAYNLSVYLASGVRAVLTFIDKDMAVTAVPSGKLR
ncbi:unnamed protein product [Didymodactylos carnosus]|uniref:Pentapeptide repeat-containing protein n=1 Tax=Didymodactylos carnosus TaxID=1234261 RepID=A0A815RF66_9BILA|nr:unnamed protein product [Didymodactylos carnosus]CAF1476447.1 unnamed protein product [Didymodactylos carnosus]CAF4158382.1 unnamed protein product [Didymodactylos carnosus]CAF4342430.1 unnamed protein product [Didymodactylos carnosus]